MSKDADHGRFVWYDLMTSDTDAGVDFYSKLIGWSTTPWEGSDMPYTMWTNKEKPFGGVMPIPDDAKAQGAPPNWLAYICVSDVSAIADKAKG
ncbi:MAG: VOC family protein, partial [bacterium]|nr:VOC family protein [bacterium]